MKKILILSVFLCLFIQGNSQTVNFADLELKRYLIHELCIDTTSDGYGDIDADLNNDNEIQFSEANRILNLHINDFHGNYRIKSVQDVNHFRQLNYLRVIHTDSLVEVSNLTLDSLKTLWIGSCLNLKVVDISTLPGLTKDFRVEDIDTLDYLNIQNGSVAGYFSLFYTDHIHYACVDSIAAEYDEVAWKMISGLPTIENCTTSTIGDTNTEIGEDKSVELFPNPTLGVMYIKTSLHIENVKIFDLKGIVMKSIPIINNKIDLSFLSSGLYFLEIKTKTEIINKKVVKK